MTDKIDELMALVADNFQATEYNAHSKLRTALEAALKDCRNATLEEAAAKCEDTTEDWGDVAEESGMLTCAIEIRGMKHEHR